MSLRYSNLSQVPPGIVVGGRSAAMTLPPPCSPGAGFGGSSRRRQQHHYLNYYQNQAEHQDRRGSSSSACSGGGGSGSGGGGGGSGAPPNPLAAAAGANFQQQPRQNHHNHHRHHHRHQKMSEMSKSDHQADSGSAGLNNVSSMSFSAEELASQLTAMDLRVFQSIGPDELTSCSWNKRDKLTVAPNIVALTKRFNHVSFWTIEEILNRGSPKQRAEAVTHFIRLAKRLHELNNLHSEYAVLSALQSAPIYRLAKTWGHLSKKDRQTFEKLADLFSENDNFNRLREHMDGIALKHLNAVPYLGLYLTDLVYIDMAHPHPRGGLEPPQRQIKMNNILRIVAELQQSSYENLIVSSECKEYLKSIKFIDELQKFVEDDQWKRSVALEPDETAHNNAASVSRDSLKEPHILAELNLSPAKAGGGAGNSGGANQKKFVPGHGRSKSDGASIFLACGRTCPNGSTEALPHLPASVLGQHPQGDHLVQHRLHLLDDSLIEFPPVKANACENAGLNGEDPSERSVVAAVKEGGGGFGLMNSSGVRQAKTAATLNASNAASTDSSKMAKAMVTPADFSAFVAAQENCGRMGGAGPKELQHGGQGCCDSLSFLKFRLESPFCIFQSMLKRKALVKEGRRLTLSGWQRYWVELWDSSLVYFSPKTLTKSLERKDYKSEPCKHHCLKGWIVLVPDTPLAGSSCFQLNDPVRKNVYKFQADCADVAQIWIHRIQESIYACHYANCNTNLISFE